MKKMKKNVWMFTGCAIVLSIASSAYSAEGLYASGNLGLAMRSDGDITSNSFPGITVAIESDDGLALAGSIGYGFNNNIRVEGEIAYQKNDFDKANVHVSHVPTWSRDLTGDTSSLALLVNGYYDFSNKSAFTPFISGGLGYANVELNDFNMAGLNSQNTSDDDTVFVYQVGVGVGYAVNEKISLDAKYRYFAAEDQKFDISEAEYTSHNIYGGIRVAF